MRKAVIALSLAVALLVGCFIGAVGSPLVIPPVRAGTNPPKWEYVCADMINKSAGEMTTTYNRLGRQGWELAGVGRDEWCFKRQLN